MGIGDANGCYSIRIAEVTKAWSKLHPEPRIPRPPILAKHMLAMRELCDLEGDDKDVAMFATANFCWAGIHRLGEFLALDEH